METYLLFDSFLKSLTNNKENQKKKIFTCICKFYVLPPIAAPFWLHKPSNLVLAPNENGQLQCLASGNPKPSIQWLVNGEPIESESALQSLFFYPYNTVLPNTFCQIKTFCLFFTFETSGSLENPSREVVGDAIIFSSVQIGTSAVYQCNASNEHGYLLANAFVNILGKRSID